MHKDTLDQPEEKRLSGLDLKINRYHIINPDAGELMITELRSKGCLWILIFITCCGLGAITLFMGYDAYRQDESVGALLLTVPFGLFFMFLGCFAVFKNFFSKNVCHFTATELIDSGLFGKKRIFPREHVRSVFIHETKNYENGRYTGSDYSVYLSIPGYKNEGQHQLMNISNEDISRNPRHTTMTGIAHGAQSEAYTIANIIANHWSIPLSV